MWLELVWTLMWERINKDKAVIPWVVINSLLYHSACCFSSVSQMIGSLGSTRVYNSLCGIRKHVANWAFSFFFFFFVKILTLFGQCVQFQYCGRNAWRTVNVWFSSSILGCLPAWKRRVPVLPGAGLRPPWTSQRNKDPGLGTEGVIEHFHIAITNNKCQDHTLARLRHCQLAQIVR